MVGKALVLAFALFSSVKAQCIPSNSVAWLHAPSIKDSSLDAFVIAGNLTSPRGVRWSNDTLFVVDVGVGILTFVENTNGCTGWTKTTIVQNPDLNHGLLINGTQIYASTVDAVYRYAWDPSRHLVSGNETLITGMNLDQNHKTRTLELSGSWLLVSGGASENIQTEAVDASSGTAQIRRFGLNSTTPSSGYNWFDGEVVAWGMRNAVGIRLSQDGSKLWTVENSADQLNYTVGSQIIDVHLDNPAEEMNVVDLSDIGHFYGYPECFTAWNMSEVVQGTSLHTGDQFSIVSNVTDAQCGNKTFNVPPRLSMQAHSAPLDILFYSAPSGSDVAVNTDYNTHAFVSFHGSWNRDPPTGYGVVRVPWSGDSPSAPSDSGNGYSFIVQPPDLTQCPNGCIRPAGLAFDSKGRLFVSSDATGEVFVIQAAGKRGAASSSTNSLTIWSLSLLVLFMTHLLA